MPNRDPRLQQLATLRAEISAVTRRTEVLRREHAPIHEWRRLQFDALCAYLDGQRRFVAMQTMMLTAVKAERQIHGRQRTHALELFAALSVLHDLMRAIDDEILEPDAFHR